MSCMALIMFLCMMPSRKHCEVVRGRFGLKICGMKTSYMVKIQSSALCEIDIGKLRHARYCQNHAYYCQDLIPQT